MTISLAFIWDIIKVGVIPAVAILWAVVKSRVGKIESDINKNKELVSSLKERLLILETNAVTSDKLTELSNNLTAIFKDEIEKLNKDQHSSEERIEKLLEAKLESLQTAIEGVKTLTQFNAQAIHQQNNSNNNSNNN